MIDLELVHVVTIKRRTESIVAQVLVHGLDATIASNVPCWIQPRPGAMVVNAMGISQAEDYDAVFLANQDLKFNDLLTWIDPADGQTLTLVVRSVERVRDNMFGPGLESHVNAELHLREIDGT